MELSDQTANLTHETESFIFIVWKCFLAFNVQSIIRTDGGIQNLLNKYSNTMTKDRMSFYSIIANMIFSHKNLGCCLIGHLHVYVEVT